MKNFLIFIAGIITGVFTIFLIGVLGNKSNSTIPGLTVFDAPGEVMDAQSYKVFQVIDGGYALANASTFITDYIHQIQQYGYPQGKLAV